MQKLNKDRGEARRNGGANREGKPGTIRNADQVNNTAELENISF